MWVYYGCLASGVARPEMSGIISSIADQARKLEPTSTVNPVVRLESDQGSVAFNFFFFYGKSFPFMHDHFVRKLSCEKKTSNSLEKLLFNFRFLFDCCDLQILFDSKEGRFYSGSFQE